MAARLLSLGLLVGLVYLGWANKQTCPKYASTCRECIQAGPACAWCVDPDLPKAMFRCHSTTELLKVGCGQMHIYDPQGSVQAFKNDSRTGTAEAETLFLQPQALNISLRPGVAQSFHLSITRVKDLTELNLDIGPIPAGVNITLNSISRGDPQVIQVNVEATQCAGGNGPWSVNFTPRGFSQSLVLQLTLECECDCMRDRDENSPRCSSRGALVCGKCDCNVPYSGHRCQKKIELSVSPNEDRCRSSPTAPVCSGRGNCVEGNCECDRRANPEERYSGQFCECDNFLCIRHNNRLCGGRGSCVCGECICDKGWTGEGCSCSMETASCMATNQQLCNGNGMCQCGRCRCEPPYTGPTCELCPVCVGQCQQHKECVECRAFGTGRKKDRCEEECGYFSLKMVESREDLPQSGETFIHHCKMMDNDACVFYYTYATQPSSGQATVVRAKEC